MAERSDGIPHYAELAKSAAAAQNHRATPKAKSKAMGDTKASIPINELRDSLLSHHNKKQAGLKRNGSNSFAEAAAKRVKRKTSQISAAESESRRAKQFRSIISNQGLR